MNAEVGASRGVQLALAPIRARSDAHDLLLDTVAAAIGAPRSGLRLDHDPLGRPEVVGAAGLHVSLSHSGGSAVVALTRLGPVGVDLEGPRSVPARRLAARFFAPADLAWLDSLGADLLQVGFRWLWTHKEALAKMRGRGLRGGALAEPVPLPADWPPPDAGRFQPLAVDPAIWTASPRCDDELALAVAVRLDRSRTAPELLSATL